MTGQTWDRLIAIFAAVGKPQTKQRKLHEFRKERWDRLKSLPVVATTATDFLDVLNEGGQMTRQYLSSLQTLAIEIGAISHVILPRKFWPKIARKPCRAITLDEHRMLRTNIHSIRWRLFLELLWETGAAQSDAANFRIEQILEGIITYKRMKTGQRAAQYLSPELVHDLKAVIIGRKEGVILPNIAKLDSKDRASIFRRACKRCDIAGVTLHSYRYAWAERAFEAGVPERLAMVALGHNSAAIHRAYAKNAKIVAPSLATYGLAKADQTPE